MTSMHGSLTTLFSVEHLSNCDDLLTYQLDTWDTIAVEQNIPLYNEAIDSGIYEHPFIPTCSAFVSDALPLCNTAPFEQYTNMMDTLSIADSTTHTYTYTTQRCNHCTSIVTPEPATWTLLVLCLICIWFLRKSR